MAKTIELHFITEEGKTARLSIENPKEPVDMEKVKGVMEQIIDEDVFVTDYGNYVATKLVRVVERNVTNYEIE